MKIKPTLFRQDTPHLFFSLLIFAGCALAFLTAPFGGSFGRNVFYITSYLALAGFIVHSRYYLQEKKPDFARRSFACRVSKYYLDHDL